MQMAIAIVTSASVPKLPEWNGKPGGTTWLSVFSEWKISWRGITSVPKSQILGKKLNGAENS
jgi:hypothetical protein